MPSYHLLSTQRNPDGSFSTPSLDEVFTAAGAAEAVAKARQFPCRRFDIDSDVSWLVDEAGQVLWFQDLAVSAAA